MPKMSANCCAAWKPAPYAGIVRQARRAFEQSHDPFNLDAALDRAYYEGLAQRAHALGRMRRKSAFAG
jgi:vacuolar-type H+-ATPase subunit C/Vma6